MRAIPLLAALLVMTGCGQSGDMAKRMSESLTTYDIAEAPPSADVNAPEPRSGPQIAYTYQVTYDLGGVGVAVVQDRQLALCRRLGPTRCQLLKTSMSAAGDDGVGTTDQTLLLVDARIAAEFNKRLDAIAVDAGATFRNRQTEAEDVTKQVIDIEARVRAKQALAERLLALIRTANGKVGDLVEAERAYATTQEELEAARAAQAELRRRVRMSQVTITFTQRPAGGALAPVRASFRSAGETLADSLAMLVTFTIAAAPWALLLAFLLWLRRRLGWRWPFRRRTPPPA